MDEKFDAIVIGAGPSGNAAAYTMAKAGLKVLQIERGEYPGSKNVQGAILYSKALEEIIPDFREDAPLERHLIEQQMWVLDDESYIGTTYRSAEFNQEPFNRYTIIRAQFDKWFSKKVQEAGALLVCETTVSNLLMDRDRVKPLFDKMVVNRFAFDVELLFLCARFGLSVAEVPVTWRNATGSKVSVVRDPLNMIVDVLRARWRFRRGLYNPEPGAPEVP